MNCDLKWTADHTIDYITSTLSLPRKREIAELGLRWSFSYGLVFGDHFVPLRKTLEDAGIVVGSTVQISIDGRYEYLYKNEIGHM